MPHRTNSIDFIHPTIDAAGAALASLPWVLGRVGTVLRTGVAALLVFLSPSLTSAAEKTELRLASDLWPPFTNVADQSRLAIDLVHEALARADITATTSITEFGSVILGLQDGNFDGCGALWRSAERESFLHFSDPYLENRLVLVGGAGSDVTAADLSDLEGKKVALVGTYAYGDTVKTATGPVFVKGQSDQENLQKLLAGEVDYMLVDELLIRYVMLHQKSEAAKYLQVGSTPLVRRPLHFAMRKTHPDSNTIIEKFNAEIQNMLADGTYNKILQLNWIRADIDGDGRTELVPMNPRAGKIPLTGGYRIPAPDQTEASKDKSDRYFIDGKTYEGWENVPESFKEAGQTRQDPDIRTPYLYKFSF